MKAIIKRPEGHASLRYVGHMYRDMSVDPPVIWVSTEDTADIAEADPRDIIFADTPAEALIKLDNKYRTPSGTNLSYFGSGQSMGNQIFRMLDTPVCRSTDKNDWIEAAAKHTKVIVAGINLQSSVEQELLENGCIPDGSMLIHDPARAKRKLSARRSAKKRNQKKGLIQKGKLVTAVYTLRSVACRSRGWSSKKRRFTTKGDPWTRSFRLEVAVTSPREYLCGQILGMRDLVRALGREHWMRKRKYFIQFLEEAEPFLKGMLEAEHEEIKKLARWVLSEIRLRKRNDKQKQSQKANKGKGSRRKARRA